MNKRCVVNVATGDFYCRMQSRLKDTFYESVSSVITSHTPEGHKLATPSESGIDLICWRDCIPQGSQSHSESPYGFKMHAIRSAYELGYNSILWLDSAAYCVKEDITPIFEKIEKHGYYAMSHTDPLENWVGDTTLSVYGKTRDELKGYNLPSGSCYGFKIDGPMPTDWPMRDYTELFWQMYFMEQDGMFKSEIIGEGKWHRHDEAILAMELMQRGLPTFYHDPLFQSDSPECIIRNGDFGPMEQAKYGNY